ncbi:MAG: acyl-ACP desaturase [Cytophagales bacterium]|nr:acyl-ACP desaturase [Bernardetiaceae bacterium]MDW8205874.1 acyl-ACP desaturase [Cytophagales bacterium]
MSFSQPTRSEVMRFLDSKILGYVKEFLKPIDENWQPADLLPNAAIENFFEEVKRLQERARELSYDLIAVLVGDTITEEALPSYESWLHTVQGINDAERESGWRTWTRYWTAEENRHGDVLNRYLYLSGRINMREMEASTQYLIADGFDTQIGDDPYRTFIYTSFQELATNISHRRVASLAKKQGDPLLAKICGQVAADEARHAKAYITFIRHIFEIDPNEAILAFEDMMRKKIVMPAHFMREIGVEIGKTFAHFTDAAQRLGVYTAADYVDITRQLLKEWNIEGLTQLKDSGEKAREYLLQLPARLERIAERIKIPQMEYKFRWILA